MSRRARIARRLAWALRPGGLTVRAEPPCYPATSATPTTPEEPRP